MDVDGVFYCHDNHDAPWVEKFVAAEKILSIWINPPLPKLTEFHRNVHPRRDIVGPGMRRDTKGEWVIIALVQSRGSAWLEAASFEGRREEEGEKKREEEGKELEIRKILLAL